MPCLATLVICVSAWLSSHGYDAPHRDAVLNYIKHESDFHPDVIERTGVCLFQHAGIRRKQILALGGGVCPPWDIQMQFADAELHDQFRGFWRSSNPRQHMKQHFGAGAISP